MELPQSRILIWHSPLQREHQTAQNKINYAHPNSVTFLSSAKTTNLRKISTVINHHHSPLFGKSWMILVHLSWFKEFWHVVLFWMLKVLFFVVVSFHHTHTLQEVAQKSHNINCQRGEEAHCPCSLKMKTYWRNLTLTGGASVED